MDTTEPLVEGRWADRAAGRVKSAPGVVRTVVNGWSVGGLLVRLTITLLTGLTWSVRSAQEVLFHPDYRAPSGLADYFAVYAFSAAWLLTAGALLILREVAPPIPKLSRAIVIVASAAALAGVANGIEDGLGAKWLGFVYAISAMVGLIGMFVVGRLLWSSPARRLAFVPLAAGATMATFTTVVGPLGFVPWLVLAIFIVIARTAPREDAGPGAPPSPGAHSR
jgi:hypothetical protein